VRYHARPLHEPVMINSSPSDVLADGTDWRFLNDLERELKA
jgi:NitT/TauT family transport system substrate-binding protein